MTFLNPGFLFRPARHVRAARHPFAESPHRATRRLSSLEFLRNLEKKSLRRVRVRQWLLLAVRMLVIAATASRERPAPR